MIDDELRELDAWLAEHGYIKEHSESLGWVPPFTTDPKHFAAVQREIARRGWSWESKYLSRAPKDICYRFTVFTENWTNDGCVNASSEELAGCLAFKRAAEATSNEGTD